MNTKAAENREKRNEQNTADANCADEQSDDHRHDRKCESRTYLKAQPAAKLVSSLVRSTVSRFITA